jgi:hypothetical protein
MVLAEGPYQDFTGDDTATVTEATYPGDPGDDIESGDSHSVIAKKAAARNGKIEVYSIQQGVKKGAKRIVLAKAPASTLRSIKDRKHGFARVTLAQLLLHLKSKARPVDYTTLKELKDERDQPIDWEGDVELSKHLEDVEYMIDTLEKDHKIFTSRTDLMATYLADIERQSDTFLRKALDEWKVLTTTARSWGKFKELFAEADWKRRQLIKANAGGRTDGGATPRPRHSVNNASDADVSGQEVFADMLAAALTAYHHETEAERMESINAAVGGLRGELESKYKAYAPPAQAKGGDDAASLKKEIADLKKQLATAKPGRNTSTTAGRDAGRAAAFEADPRPKCSHCGFKHGPQEGGCYRKDPASAPEWWKERMRGRGHQL